MQIDHTIQIDAPRAAVWAVTTDIEKWPEWTPTVESAKRLDDRQFDVGSSARLKQPGLPEATWTVTSFTRGERFTWESRLWGMHMLATHELEPVDAGTQNLLRIEVTGFVATLMWPLMRSRLRQALEQENAGLKRRSEEIATHD